MTAASPSLAGDLTGRHLVLGLTGGVACYKSAELLRVLVRAGATVQVVMTESAERFIGAATMQALSNRPVYTNIWDAREPNAMAHINLTRDADAIIVAPASADFMARLVHGAAADLLSLLCLARPIERCPLMLAPAMNREMWAHPATQRNADQLVVDGTVLLGPGHGDQACGEFGDGRMLEPADIAASVVAWFQPKVLAGKRVLITAGPTFEPLDPVRGITNRSSGKMGFAMAQAAADAGATVTLVAGPVTRPTPRGVRRLDVETGLQMHAAVMSSASACDVFIATAAVADWRAADIASQKIKKAASEGAPVFALVENPDILAAVAALPVPPFCVGFAAETSDLEANARAKLEKKRLGLVVANHGPLAFGQDDNTVMLVDAKGTQALPPTGKLALARRLIAEIATRLAR